MWSQWRREALQYGPRHEVSRQVRNRFIAAGNSREVASIATSSPEVGCMYRRRNTVRTAGPAFPKGSSAGSFGSVVAARSCSRTASTGTAP